MFHVLGIRAISKRVEGFDYEYPRFVDPPLGSVESAHDIPDGLLTSKLDLFDFNEMINLYYEQKEKVIHKEGAGNTVKDQRLGLENLRKDDQLIALGTFNSFFIICSYLRGMDQFLLDLAGNKRLAEKIINIVGEFCLEYNRRELEHFGEEADYYCCWDDVATQDGSFFQPGLFEKYFLGFYKRLIDNTKKYGLVFDWHCCGSVHEILPFLIDAGIDIFDVVQTSAKDMDLETVYNRYGRSVCIHGGMDVQDLLVQKSTREVKNEVMKVIDLWGNKGGIILSPSHECIPGTPVENIKAIYDTLNEYYNRCG